MPSLPDWRKFAPVFLLASLLCAPLFAQDPAGSADRPPGNVNELTLAGIQPGLTRLDAVLRRFGPHWTHPTPNETAIYLWCSSSGLSLSVDTGDGALIEAVTVQQGPPGKPGCSAPLAAAALRTGRGLQLGAPVARLRAAYGKPFFDGPSMLAGASVELIVYNFAWAGADKPQVLESSCASGRLIKMTLSAQYY